jgi:cell division protein FtsB
MGRLLAETQALVSALLKENRSLKAENKRLAAEVDRLGKGWEELRRLARAAPRAKR